MVSSRRMKLLQLPVQCECVFWCRGCVNSSKHKLTAWRRLFRWIPVWSKGAIITKQRKSLKNIEHVFGYYWSGETPFLLAQVITSHPLLLFLESNSSASRPLVSESRSQSTPKWTQMWNFDFSGSKKLHFLSCWCCVQSEKVTSEQLLTVTRGAPSHVPSCSTVEPPDNVVLCEKLHSYDSGCFIVVHDMLTRPNWAR